MTHRWNYPVLLLAGLALLIGPPAVRADWLVTLDGHRVETQGPWRVDGQSVLFELPTGSLMSLRLSEIDLDASREATERALQRVEESRQETPPAPRRESVYRLTDADVGHVEDDADSVEEGGPEDEEGADNATAGRRNLVVTEWSDDTDPEGDGVQLIGTLRNSSGDTSGNIRLVVRLYDVDGAFLASTDARLPTSALPPGETTSFEAEFPGVFVYSAVRFETESIDFRTATPGASEGAGEVDSEDFEEWET